MVGLAGIQNHNALSIKFITSRRKNGLHFLPSFGITLTGSNMRTVESNIGIINVKIFTKLYLEATHRIFLNKDNN